jgi:hypothetical protein
MGVKLDEGKRKPRVGAFANGVLRRYLDLRERSNRRLGKTT